MTEAIWQAAVCAASALSDQDRLSSLWEWMQRFHSGWHASTGEAQVSLSFAIVDSRPSKGALAQKPGPKSPERQNFVDRIELMKNLISRSLAIGNSRT